MKKMPYPCLWFDHQAREAAEFYCSLIPNSAILSENPMVTSFQLWGSPFMGLNGGSQYQVNAGISYFIYTGEIPLLDKLYAGLSEGGRILDAVGEYPWSARYARVEDRFGVCWHLDSDPIRSEQKIVPTLIFSGSQKWMLAEAMDWYTGIFPESRHLMQMPLPPEPGTPAGALAFAQFKIGQYILNALCSQDKEYIEFSPGNSFVLECENQEEIDYYWEKLGAGGRYDRCGWLADRYGVSWQIIPDILPQLMRDPQRAQKVVEAFLPMTKMDYSIIQNA